MTTHSTLWFPSSCWICLYVVFACFNCETTLFNLPRSVVSHAGISACLLFCIAYARCSCLPTPCLRVPPVCSWSRMLAVHPGPSPDEVLENQPPAEYVPPPQVNPVPEAAPAPVGRPVAVMASQAGRPAPTTQTVVAPVSGKQVPIGLHSTSPCPAGARHMAALWKTVSTPLSRLCLPLSASLVSESTVAHGLCQTEDSMPSMLSCLLVACMGCGATCFCFQSLRPPPSAASAYASSAGYGHTASAAAVPAAVPTDLQDFEFPDVDPFASPEKGAALGLGREWGVWMKGSAHCGWSDAHDCHTTHRVTSASVSSLSFFSA